MTKSKSRPANLLQLAFAYKSGKLKSEELPKGSRNKIKRYADVVPIDELEAMSIPRPPINTHGIHRLSAERNVRST